jgi:dTDP-4-dehydrorhamnose 3,5-epimerase
MKIIPTRISGLILVEPKTFGDDRGSFFEAYHETRYREAGITDHFVQDNVSVSNSGVLRGLHFQNPNPQSKLVQVLRGSVWDVAVDLRQSSPTFGQWEAYELSEHNHRQFYIPTGFAHGFVVLEGPAMLSYKCSALYDPVGDTTLRFDDPRVAVPWPVSEGLILSEKDRNGKFLADIAPGRLFE